MYVKTRNLNQVCLNQIMKIILVGREKTDLRGENFLPKRFANNQSSRGAWNARKALNMRVSYYLHEKWGEQIFSHPANYFFTLASLGRKNNFPGGKKFFSPISMQVIYLPSRLALSRTPYFRGENIL